MKHILLAAALSLSVVACSDGATTSLDIPALPAVVNPNTASAADLLAAGLSDDAADIIMANRPFADGVAFANYADANGMEDMLANVFVPLSLNTADEEDFLVIPDLSEKMAHEFIEYRPYANIEQWQGEMSKYVNADEIARMQRYVVLD